VRSQQKMRKGGRRERERERERGRGRGDSEWVESQNEGE
jgi:hypothetical protein